MSIWTPFFVLAVAAVVMNLIGTGFSIWNLLQVRKDMRAWQDHIEGLGKGNPEEIIAHRSAMIVLDEQNFSEMGRIFIQVLLFSDRIPGLLIAPERYAFVLEQFWIFVVLASLNRLLVSAICMAKSFKAYRARNRLKEEALRGGH